MNSKICKNCNIEKELINFYNNKRNKDGKEIKCKDCVKEFNKNNRQKLLEAQRKWRAKNPDYMKNYDKKEEIKEYRKQYYQEHKEVYIKRKQEWRKNNPEKAVEERINYIKNNKEKINKYHAEWKKNKRQTNIEYKIKENTSRRIRYELNTLLKGKKTKRTIEYIGCDMIKLKEHLESKFHKEMNWDNYGEVWHIDHIIPCASWDLNNEFENKCCWNYRNLQPLFATENHTKKDKFDENSKKCYIDLMRTIF